MKVAPKKPDKKIEQVVRVVFTETIDIPLVRLKDYVAESREIDTDEEYKKITIASEDAAVSVMEELGEGNLRGFLWAYEWVGAGEDNWEAEVSLENARTE